MHTKRSLSAVSRLSVSPLLVSALLLSACAPKQDPADPDQCPDVNYGLTTLRDAQFVASIPAIDNEVLVRMAGKFPGCAIGIVDHGQVAYLKAYGIADLNGAGAADDEPFTTSTVCGIGSVSKVLTAVAVMRLAEMNQLSLDSAISTYFPHAVPAGYGQVTVRNLLSHRGGFVRDPNSAQPGTLTPAQVEAAFGAKASQHPRFAIWEFLGAANGTPDITKIGTYTYSNIGYVLLGAIVDNITSNAAFPGGPVGYEKFVWSLFADRAQDTALTTALDHPWRANDIVGLAQSYDAANMPMDTDYSGWQSACGGWSMTIGDLSRVLVALTGNQVISAASLTQMRTNPGPGIGTDNYGLGLFLDSRIGRPAFWHGGVIDGFRTQMTYWPNQQVGVVVMANRDAQGVGAIADAVGKVWIEQAPAAAPPSRSQQAEMNTPAYEVSRHHFAGAERIVRGLIATLGADRTASRLIAQVGAQSSLGRLLVDQVRRAPTDVQSASRLFLDVLGRDGHVGDYR